MTGPRVDPLADYSPDWKQQQGTADPLADYHPSWRVTSQLPRIASDATSALPRNRENPSGDYGVLGRGIAANVLNAAQGIPGMEAFEAGMGALGSQFTDHPMGYRESLKTLRSATEPIPGLISLPEKLLGGGALASMLPAKTVMQAAKSGAALGAADQALSANPDESVKARALKTAVGGAIGGAIGGGAALVGKGINKVRELKPLAERVRGASTPDELAVVQSKVDKAANIENYGTAARQADAVGGSTPALQAVLSDPDVKPYADMVRATKTGANADDATVLRMVRKIVSKERTSALTKNKIPGEYDPKADLRAGDLRDVLRRLDQATAAPSQKPPLTMDIAPEVYERAPRVIDAGHEPVTGPIPGAGVERPLRESEPLKVRDSSGNLRRDLSQVADDELVNEWRRLAEMNASEEAAHAGVMDAGYRRNYEELPRTEKYGMKGREDLPDADGELDPETLLRDNKTVAGYNKTAVLRKARERAMERIDAELQRRPSAFGSDADFDFGLNASADERTPHLGPAGPQFQMAGRPPVVRPGVRIESPAMRIQTAPAEDVPAAMPSFPAAVAERARMGRDRDAFNTAVGMTRRITGGKVTPVKQLEDKSPAAWLDQILGYSPSELERATAGTLGAAKEGMGIHAPTSHATLFGTLSNLAKPATRLNRIAPYVRALDEAAGRSVVQPREWEDVLRALGVLNAPLASGGGSP